jgi:hypothetical protein
MAEWIAQPVIHSMAAPSARLCRAVKPRSREAVRRAAARAQLPSSNRGREALRSIGQENHGRCRRSAFRQSLPWLERGQAQRHADFEGHVGQRQRVEIDRTQVDRHEPDVVDNRARSGCWRCGSASASSLIRIYKDVASASLRGTPDLILVPVDDLALRCAIARLRAVLEPLAWGRGRSMVSTDRGRLHRVVSRPSIF